MLRRSTIQAPTVAAITALLAAMGPASAPAAALEPTLRERATVVQVVDGDTVNVRLASGDERPVRLIGIDTPEVYPTRECGGAQASRSLQKLLPAGTAVRLASDPTQDRNDRYGRMLRYVIIVGDGRDVSRVQVRRGWATVYVFRHNPFTRTAAYRRAQAHAGANDRGIWGLC